MPKAQLIQQIQINLYLKLSLKRSH